jgi:hypothetical protein
MEQVFEIYNEDLEGTEKIVIGEDADGLGMTEIQQVVMERINHDGRKGTFTHITARVTFQEEAIPFIIKALQARLQQSQKAPNLIDAPAFTGRDD